MNDPHRAAYAAGLAMLARREMSEARLRERLAGRDHPPETIEAAVVRLRAAGALDDRRVALSVARTEASVRLRGRARVLNRLHNMGIDEETADAAVAAVFDEVGDAALLERALARRLRGRSADLSDPAFFRRVYQHLVRQGFPGAAVLAALRVRRHGAASPVPDDDDQTV